MLNSNCKPQSIRLQADRSQWVSEELLLPTMSQEGLWATDVHRALLRATLQWQRAVQHNWPVVQLIELRDVLRLRRDHAPRLAGQMLS